MIRKLIMLAVTGAVAKKAWDSYQLKNGGMASGGTGSTSTKRYDVASGGTGGVARAGSDSGKDKPSAL